MPTLDPTKTPDSPPASPVIPKGLATYLGIAGSLVLALVAAFSGVIDGLGPAGAILLAKYAAILTGVTAFGRMLQAAAAFLGGNKVDDSANLPLHEGDPEPAPDDDELKGMYPGDQPDAQEESSLGRVPPRQLPKDPPQGR